MSDITVVKYEFFKQPDGSTLRYVDAAPSSAHPHSPTCGCTIDLDHRPVGAPSEVQWSVKYLEEHNGQTIGLSLHSHKGIWASWPWPKDVPQHPFLKDSEGHAYFWPNNGLQIEIVGLPGVPEQALLSRMFFDDTADISRLYNGHSPSKIIDLPAMKGSVWLHHCSWGKEQVITLADKEEAMQWRSFSADLEEAFTAYDAIKNELGPNVNAQTLREKLLPLSFKAAERAITWIAQVLKDLPTTELAAAASKLEQSDL